MKKKALQTLLVLACAVLPFGITGCKEHTHTYSDGWNYDNGSHWHDATCEHTDAKGDQAAHKYGEWVTTKEATCGEDGVMTKSCECGQQITAAIEATGEHDWKNGTIVEEATCTTEGKVNQTCNVCGETRVAPLAKHSPTLKAVAEVLATCTQSGNVAYWYCEDCDAYFLDAQATIGITDKTLVVIPAKEHNIVKVEAKAATCFADGNVEYYECPQCDKFFEDAAATKEIVDKASVVLPGGHTYDTTYSFDAESHWYAASCEHDLKKNVAPHVFNADDICECGYVKSFVTSGRITDQYGNPIVGVTVSNGTNVALTDEYGVYEIFNAVGTQVITYSKEGYLSKSTSVAGEWGQEKWTNVKLVKGLRGGEELTVVGAPTELNDANDYISYNVYNEGATGLSLYTGKVLKDGDTISYTFKFNGASEGKKGHGEKINATVANADNFLKNTVDNIAFFIGAGGCYAGVADWEKNNYAGSATASGKNPLDFSMVRNHMYSPDYQYEYDFMWTREGNVVSLYVKHSENDYWVLQSYATVTEAASEIKINVSGIAGFANNWTVSNLEYGVVDEYFKENVWDYAEVGTCYGGAGKNYDGTYDAYLQLTDSANASGDASWVIFNDNTYDVVGGKLEVEADVEVKTTFDKTWGGTGVGFSLDDGNGKFINLFYRCGEWMCSLVNGHGGNGTRIWNLNGHAGVLEFHNEKTPKYTQNQWVKYTTKYVYVNNVLSIYVAGYGEEIDESKDLVIKVDLLKLVANMQGNVSGDEKMPDLSAVKLAAKLMHDRAGQADRANVRNIKVEYNSIAELRSAKIAAIDELRAKYKDADYTAENLAKLNEVAQDHKFALATLFTVDEIDAYDLNKVDEDLSMIINKYQVETTIAVTGAQGNDYALYNGETVLSGKIKDDGTIVRNLIPGVWEIEINYSNSLFPYYGEIIVSEQDNQFTVAPKVNEYGLNFTTYGTNPTQSSNFDWTVDVYADDYLASMEVNFYNDNAGGEIWTLDRKLAAGETLSFRTTFNDTSYGKYAHGINIGTNTYLNGNGENADMYIKHEIGGKALGLSSTGSAQWQGGTVVKSSPLTSLTSFMTNGQYFAYDVTYARVGNRVYQFVKMADETEWVNISYVDVDAGDATVMLYVASRYFAQNYTYSNVKFESNAESFYNANKDNVADQQGEVYAKGEGVFDIVSHSPNLNAPVYTPVQGNQYAGTFEMSATFTVERSGPYTGFGFALVDPATDKFVNLTTNVNTGAWMVSTANSNGYGRRIQLQKNTANGVTMWNTAGLEAIDVSNRTANTTFKAKVTVEGYIWNLYVSKSASELDTLLHIGTINMETLIKKGTYESGGNNNDETRNNNWNNFYPTAKMVNAGAFAFTDGNKADFYWTDYTATYTANAQVDVALDLSYNAIPGNGGAVVRNAKVAQGTVVTLTNKGGSYTGVVGADGKATVAGVPTGTYAMTIPSATESVSLTVKENMNTVNTTFICDYIYNNDGNKNLDMSEIAEGTLIATEGGFTQAQFNPALKVVYAEMKISYSGEDLASDVDAGHAWFKFKNAEGDATFGGHHDAAGNWRTRWGDSAGWSGLGNFTEAQLAKFKGEGLTIALAIYGGDALAFVENDEGKLVQVGEATKVTNSSYIYRIGCNLGSSKITNIKYSETVPDWCIAANYKNLTVNFAVPEITVDGKQYEAFDTSLFDGLAVTATSGETVVKGTVAGGQIVFEKILKGDWKISYTFNGIDYVKDVSFTEDYEVTYELTNTVLNVAYNGHSSFSMDTAKVYLGSPKEGVDVPDEVWLGYYDFTYSNGAAGTQYWLESDIAFDHWNANVNIAGIMAAVSPNSLEGSGAEKLIIGVNEQGMLGYTTKGGWSANNFTAITDVSAIVGDTTKAYSYHLGVYRNGAKYAIFVNDQYVATIETEFFGASGYGVGSQADNRSNGWTKFTNFVYSTDATLFADLEAKLNADVVAVTFNLESQYTEIDGEKVYWQDMSNVALQKAISLQILDVDGKAYCVAGTERSITLNLKKGNYKLVATFQGVKGKSSKEVTFTVGEGTNTVAYEANLVDIGGSFNNGVETVASFGQYYSFPAQDAVNFTTHSYAFINQVVGSKYYLEATLSKTQKGWAGLMMNTSDGAPTNKVPKVAFGILDGTLYVQKSVSAAWASGTSHGSIKNYWGDGDTYTLGCARVNDMYYLYVNGTLILTTKITSLKLDGTALPADNISGFGVYSGSNNGSTSTPWDTTFNLLTNIKYTANSDVVDAIMYQNKGGANRLDVVSCKSNTLSQASYNKETGDFKLYCPGDRAESYFVFDDKQLNGNFLATGKIKHNDTSGWMALVVADAKATGGNWFQANDLFPVANVMHGDGGNQMWGGYNANNKESLTKQTDKEVEFTVGYLNGEAMFVIDGQVRYYGGTKVLGGAKLGIYSAGVNVTGNLASLSTDDTVIAQAFAANRNVPATLADKTYDNTCSVNQGIHTDITRDAVISGKLDITDVSKDNNHVAFQLPDANNRFLLWDSDNDETFSVSWASNGTGYVNDQSLDQYATVEGKLTLEWKLVFYKNHIYFYINGELKAIYQNACGIGELVIGAEGTGAKFYDMTIVSKFNDEAAYNAAIEAMATDMAKADDNAASGIVRI